jgi:rhodanese-related sulfurtransferase
VVREITVEQLAQARNAGQPMYLLDVREPGEHATAALPGSVLVPLNELAARPGDLRVPAGVRVVVYCHHGIRSRLAAALLERQGFADVVSLAGGIDAWSLRVDPAVPRY